jgi:Domain of unknown function (DUF5671)
LYNPAMPADSKIHDFIERAKANGASDEALAGILTLRGWPEKEVYEALAAHYEKLTGMEVPARVGGASTAAKDAFFYLLIFATLATWVFGLGWLAFTLIDEWLPDRLFSPNYSQATDTAYISACVASIIVSFPIFLLVSRVVIRDIRSHPEKLNSPVRKWLTYLALVIAAGTCIGDLITALTYFLRGELTSRFIAEAFVVFVLSGGIFYYYFTGIKQSEEPEAQGRLSKHAWWAIISAVVLATMIILGFLRNGSPRIQRSMRADQKRLQDLGQLNSEIVARWRSSGHLPQHLDELPVMAMADPVTRAAYGYHAKEGSHYELCAAFDLDSHRETTDSSDQWSHPAGQHCFQLDASAPLSSPNIFIFPE